MSTITNRHLVASTLLFGGTLGAVGSAHGGMVIGDMYVFDAYVLLDADNQVATTFLVPTATAGMSVSSGDSSLTLSPFTASGFSLTATSNGSGIWSVYALEFNFTPEEHNRAVTLSGNVSSEPAMIMLYDGNTQTALFTRFVGEAGTWSSGAIVLTYGHNYSVYVNPGMASGGMETGTVLNLSISTVPAPGALALAGLAGLTRRRRKA